MSRVGARSTIRRSFLASLVVLTGLALAVGVCVGRSPSSPSVHGAPVVGAPAPGVGQSRPAAAQADTSGLVDMEMLLSSPAAAQRAAARLTSSGATVRFCVGDRLEVQVPPGQVSSLRALPGVREVRAPAQLLPCIGFGAVVSEEVQLTNAGSMQLAGFTGTNCKIAIIDQGFQGLTAVEVPVNVADPSQMVNFRADRVANPQGLGKHGTAMAEQVADMAPGARLTLIAVDTELSIESAINYVISNGFKVAVMGLVVVDGPFDGTHPLTQAVETATNAGVLWVQAAGNLAARHWSGTYTDPTGSNINQYAPAITDIAVTLPVGQFDAYLSWFETAGPLTSQDYDLLLLDGTGAFVAQSSQTQSNSPPREHLQVFITTAATYSLRIIRISGDVTKPDKFQLYIPGYDISPVTLQMPVTSLGIPAEAPDAFTIGAVRATTASTTAYNLPAIQVDNIEPFSSQGPTLLGLLKPDLVANDGCHDSLAAAGAAPIMDGGDFIAPMSFGTSFAAANVAGAAALLWSEDHTRTAAALKAALIKLAIQVPPPLPPAIPLPNDIYGNGRLSLRSGLDLTPPTIAITYPRNGDTITTNTPVVTAILTDAGSGVDPASIVVTLDGVTVTGFIYDPTSGFLTYRVPTSQALTSDSHRVTVDCKDRVGNVATQGVSNFRVSLPTISAGLHMISIPFYDLTTSQPAAMFNLPSSQVTVVRWLPTDTAIGDKYHYYGGPSGIEDAYASFTPLDATSEPPFVVSSPPAGLGYFLELGSTATMNVAGKSLGDQPDYQVKLSYGYTDPRGWNMIGCPFLSAVSWGSVQLVTKGVRQDLADAVSSGVTEGVLFDLKTTTSGDSYYDFPPDPLGGTLQPFIGYWVHVLEDTTVVMYNSQISTTQQRPRVAARAAAPTVQNWTLRFGASMAGGCDPTNYVGIAPGAGDGYVKGKDVPKPPALSAPVRVYLEHTDWGAASGRYAKEVRGALGAGQKWDVTVACDRPNADVTVSWPDLNTTVPAGVRLMLHDTVAGRDVYMRTTTGYTYRSGSTPEVRHLTLEAAPANGRTLMLNSVSAAQARDGSGVSLVYTVNTDAQVSAEIVNIAGRTVRALPARASRSDEVQTLHWDGRNGSGAKVPAGRYILRLTARTESGEAMQCVRAFDVAR